ncbi:MAG: hypothetical protein AAFV46_04730 [Cyanobacteria bacterium J06635_11]
MLRTSMRWTLRGSLALGGLFWLGGCSGAPIVALDPPPESAVALPELANVAVNSDATVCRLNEAVTTTSGQYSTNVDLTASVALPGEAGVDVVMTPWGAIAAVTEGNSGTLYWVDPATGEILKTVALSGVVGDVAYDGQGLIAMSIQSVVSDTDNNSNNNFNGNKIVVLDAQSGAEITEIELSGVSRVAMSADGFIGVIAGKTVHLYDNNNTEVFTKERDYTGVTDIEVRSCDGEQLVYVTSFRNASFVDLNGKRNPVQIARLEALDFTGVVQWSLFDDSTETIKQNVADTRLYRVTMGRDGYLYIAGESAGTATIFRWRGQPMTADEQIGRARPFVARIDEYSQLHNSGSAHLPYYARVHPTEGELVTAQMSFPRRSNTKANAMRLGDIAVGENGGLFFGGAASASIANRENLTLNGAPVGGYAGRDRTWMSIAPDFRTRNFWTVLADEGGKGIVQGVDAGYGYSAALSNVESGTVPVTTGEQAGTVFLSFTAE